MDSRRKAFLAILVGSLIGGLSSPLTKLGIKEIPPMSFAFIRFVVASLVIFPLFLQVKVPKKEIIKLLPITLFSVINIFLFINGIQRTTAINGQLLYSATPLLVGLIGFVTIKARFNLRQLTGLILGFLGILIVIILPVIDGSEKISGDTLGNLLIFLGAISFSFYNILSKDLLKKYPPVMVTSVFIFASSILLFPFFIKDLINLGGWWTTVSFNGWLALLYVAVFSTVAYYVLYQLAIKHGGIVFAPLQFYILPITGAIASTIILGEKLTPGILTGGIIALAGVFLVTSKQ